MSQPPSIKDVLTDEGYLKFLDAGVGAKLSGTTFEPEAPANGLFWAMFRRAEEQRQEADAQDELVDSLAKELVREREFAALRLEQIEQQEDRLDRQAILIARLEKTIARLAMEATYDKALLEAFYDEL